MRAKSLKPAAVLLLCALLSVINVAAQPLSYIYIQGDKQTPFYVKLEGEMQPRYGKNYCILSQLLPGVTHLEILFQQNAFPAQHFTVNVGDNSRRGFLLTRRQEAFALYDLDQGFYLENGNDSGDDKSLPARVSVPVMAPAVAGNDNDETVTKNERHLIKPVRNKEPGVVAAPAEDTGSGEHFINGIALQNDHNANPKRPDDTATPISHPSEGNTEGNDSVTGVAAAIKNSDCPQPLTKESFSPIYKDALAANDDESRTAYIIGQMDKCYASWQARTLAAMLSTDAARFTVLKNIYPRISDQGSFALLDDLLRDASYKQAFNNLLHPKQ